MVSLLCNCCCIFYHVWHRSFVWICRNFPPCCWRLSCVFVRPAFVAGKLDCDGCPKVIHTGVSRSLQSKTFGHLVFCILNSGGTLGFLIVCCFACSKAVNYYELLGVKSNATSNEIKNAFFEKSKKVGSLFPNNHLKEMCRQRRAA